MILVRLIWLPILFAFPAQAHGTLPGGGGFYSGALHPLVALEHVLALLAGGLTLGRDGMRRPVWALVPGLGAGLWVGSGVAGVQMVLLVITLGWGALLALKVGLPESVYAAGLLAVGMAVGSETDLPALDPQMAALGAGVAGS